METTTERAARNRSGSHHNGNDQISGQLHTLAADVEELLHKLGNVTDAEVLKARAKVEKALVSARSEALHGWASVRQYASNVGTYARDAGVATNRYVHDKPWVAIGVAGALGAAIGALLARRR